MKKIVLLISTFLLLSFTAENNIVAKESTTSSNQNKSQSMLSSTTNIGIYKGVFTTNDSKNRAIVLITLPSRRFSTVATRPFSSAVITMATGDIYEAKSTELAQEGVQVSNMEFSSPELNFKFSVNADGSNPIVSDLTFNNEEGAMLVLKHTLLAPITPITGTYVCTECNGNPFIDGTQEQTFNIVIDEATGEIDSQVVLGSRILNGIGFQDNCNANGNFTNCNLNSGNALSDVGFEFNGQPITWSGNHNFNNEPSNPSIDCSGVSGTWAFNTSNYGLIKGTFVGDSSCMTTIFNADFQDFTGAGFSPSPSVGQLNSNIYIVTGMSDGSMSFGDTETSGDFARGTSTGGVTTGGVYAFNVDGAGNIAWGVQSAGSDFTPGTFQVKIQNDTGADLNNFMVSYDIFVNNDQSRGNSFNFAYSTDGATYTNNPAMDYTTPDVADSNGFVKVERSTSTPILVTVADGDYLYIKFSSNDVSGSGGRDEFGVDNIIVTAN